MFNLVLGEIGESLLLVVFYLVGRLVIPIASLGRCRCLPAFSRVSQTSWGGVIHRTATRNYFTSGGTSAVGAMACLGLAALLVIWYVRL